MGSANTFEDYESNHKSDCYPNGSIDFSPQKASEEPYRSLTT